MARTLVAAGLGRLARRLPAGGGGAARGVHDQYLFAILALWWLKPLFDRFVLHVVSRAVFGDTADGGRHARRVAGDPAARPRSPASLWFSASSPCALVHAAGLAAREADRPRAAHERRDALGKRMRRLRAPGSPDRAAFRSAPRSCRRCCVVALLAPAAGDPGFEFSELFRGGGEESPAGICYRQPVLRIRGVGRRADLRRRGLLALPQPPRDPRGLGHRACTAPAGRAAARVARPRRSPRSRSPASRRLPAADGTQRRSRRSEEIQEVLKAPEFQHHQGRDALALSRASGRTRQATGRPRTSGRTLGAFFAQVSEALLWIAVAAAVVAAAPACSGAYLPQFFARGPPTTTGRPMRCSGSR